MSMEQAKQVEPTTLSTAIDRLMEEVMNSSGVSVNMTDKIIKILNRTDKKDELNEIKDLKKSITQPSFIDSINIATNMLKTSRNKTLNNLNKIESILK